MNKLTTLRSKHTPTITLPVWTNKLCTTSLHRKDSIFYANRLVTSMYWVVKWATLRKPKLIRIGPQGAPIGPEWKTQAYMNHQRKSYKWRLGPVKPAFLDGSPQKGQNTPTHHQSKPKPMQEGPHCHGSPFLTPQYSLWERFSDQLSWL